MYINSFVILSVGNIQNNEQHSPVMFGKQVLFVKVVTCESGGQLFCLGHL